MEPVGRAAFVFIRQTDMQNNSLILNKARRGQRAKVCMDVSLVKHKKKEDLQEKHSQC